MHDVKFRKERLKVRFNIAHFALQSGSEWCTSKTLMLEDTTDGKRQVIKNK